MADSQLDCLIIGYNEMPFDQYERLIRQYGDSSEAYRDLKFSFIDLNGEKLTYVDLLNHAYSLSQNGQAAMVSHPFKAMDIPNLAAVYLTNFLNQRGFYADYINLFQPEKEKLLEYLGQNPLCIAITTTFYVTSRPVVEMVEFIRSHNSSTKIVVGGPLIANYFRRDLSLDRIFLALKNLGADIYVNESQGELTLSRIIDCLRTDGDLSEVPNLIYYDEIGPHKTAVSPEVNNLNEVAINWLNFPDKALGATLQTRTARSCAFSCSFCAYPVRAGKLALTDLDVIEQELDSMRELGNVRNVVFIDDTFNVPLARFKEICRLMIRKNYGYHWFSYFRCSNADEEAIELMARSGCQGVFLGIESGSPTILKNMHKASSIEQYFEGVRLLHQYGIFTFGSFIIGFPGETEKTVQETIDFLQQTALDYYRVQLWYCEPGTPIYSKRDQYGIRGEGFKWQHDTMSSMEAMTWIEKIFLSIDSSIWMPQGFFDFWIIPYLLGKGVSLNQFKEFMGTAEKMLRLEFNGSKSETRQIEQAAFLDNMVEMAKAWNVR